MHSRAFAPGLLLALGLGFGTGLAFPQPGQAADAGFSLTPAEYAQVKARQLVIRASADSAGRGGSVRAAVRIEAPPQVVFDMMLRCADALKYVPHLRKCRVREKAADDSWQVVEQQIDFGWYAPSVNWTFRAELEPGHSIAFRQIAGDFRANAGVWQLEPTPDGATTLLLYRAHVDPPGFVPNWLARSTFRRSLPQMLTELRRRCEAEQTLRAQAEKPAR